MERVLSNILNPFKRQNKLWKNFNSITLKGFLLIFNKKLPAGTAQLRTEEINTVMNQITVEVYKINICIKKKFIIQYMI